MGNDKKEEKVENNASTDKLEDKSNNSGQEDLEDEEREVRSNSYGSESSIYSGVSERDVANTDAVPKTLSAMKKGKNQRGTTARQTGRVQKRRARVTGRRPAARRPRNPPNARKNRRNRNGLVATTVRGRSKAQIQLCENCGHQIIRR